MRSPMMPKTKMSSSTMARVLAKDVFEEMREETERLFRELQLCQRYIDLCRQYRQLVLDFRNGCVCDQNLLNETKLSTVETGYTDVEESAIQLATVEKAQQQQQQQAIQTTKVEVNADNNNNMDNKYDDNNECHMLSVIDFGVDTVTAVADEYDDNSRDYRPSALSSKRLRRTVPSKRRPYKKRTGNDGSAINNTDGQHNDDNVIVKLVKDKANRLRKRYYYFNYKCHWEGCQRRFGKHDELLAHISSAHTQERPHKCPQCDRSFATESYLRQHRKSHDTQRQRYECELLDCQKSFTTKSGLLKHRTTVHSDERPFECTYPECGAKYKSNDALKNHEYSHQTAGGGEQHNCPYQSCPKRFTTKADLEVHMARHTRSTLKRVRRNYRCHWPGCDYSGTKQELGVHVNRHQNYKPYRCPHQGCQISYYTDYDLRQHTIKVHVVTNPEDKQFKCTAQDCTKTYATERDLKRHRRRHDRIYRCSWPECDQSYAAKVLLAEHMDRHLNVKSHKCHLCPKEFFTKNNCRTHMKNVHKFIYKTN